MTSGADSGPGTLRSALITAEPGDVITFDRSVFPPDDPTAVLVDAPLPQIHVERLTIDASDAGVVIDGRELPRGDFATGIEILSDANTVRGLHILNFPGGGIVIAGGRDNIVGGDSGVGAGPSGQANVLGGNQLGIGLWLDASGNVIAAG